MLVPHRRKVVERLQQLTSGRAVPASIVGGILSGQLVGGTILRLNPRPGLSLGESLARQGFSRGPILRRLRFPGLLGREIKRGSPPGGIGGRLLLCHLLSTSGGVSLCLLCRGARSRPLGVSCCLTLRLGSRLSRGLLLLCLLPYLGALPG